MNDNITKNDVIKYINKERKSNFLNHLLTFILNQWFISGEVNKDFVLLWRSNFWIGPFFPVFCFQFNSQNELVDITFSKNSFAKALQVIFYIITIVLGLYIFSSIDYTIRSLIIPVVYGIVFSLANYLMYSIYKSETKNQLNDLYDLIGIEITKEIEIKKSEWSASKISTRLIMYPLSVFLLYMLRYLLHEGKIIHWLTGSAIILSYLITDIIILFRKSKK